MLNDYFVISDAMEPQESRRTPRVVDASIAGLYDMECSLGSGHFAIVKLARHVFTGEKVAVKVIDKSKLDGISKDHLYQEVQCMKLVQHPNVVRLYEVIDTQTKLYLILEYGDGGDMYDHIMKHEGQGISEAKARHYFKQIVSAIDYCHKLHVVHRDLKPENVIFFKSQDLAKLTDFGFSNNFLPGEKLYTSCGSLAYSAPEILLGDSYDAPAVDVWSLGVILFMMVCGRGPFSHANDNETMTMIMDCKYELPDALSEDCKRLISKMLVRPASQRASLESIVNDPWLNDGSVSSSVSLSTTPLISEISISKEVHLNVLQKMEEGKIASKEQIVKCLNDDEYNHITATYFLIAERILKRKYGKTPLHVKLEESTSLPPETRHAVFKSLESSQEPCPSHCCESLTLENEMDDPLPLTNDLTKELSQSDEYLLETCAALAQEFQVNPLQPRSQRKTYPITGKPKNKSTPNLLNEISEENESEIEESPRTSPKLQRRSSSRRKARYHTCRLSPIHSRRSSCSSSDDDEMQLLVEKLRLTGQKLPQVVSNQSNPNNSQSSSSGGSDNVNNEPNECLKEAKIDDNLASLLLPALALKLAPLENHANHTYGKHLSDTNLTSYSLYLQSALCKGKSGDRLYQTKCSSDTNLVSTLFKRKHYLSQDLFKTKELLVKYFKRGCRPGRTSSSLSLSSPIEEEPSHNSFHVDHDRHMYSSNEDFVDDTLMRNGGSFHKLDGIRSNPSLRDTIFDSESRNSFFKSDKFPYRYHHSLDLENEDFERDVRRDDISVILQGCAPQASVQMIPTVTSGSACCSLV